MKRATDSSKPKQAIPWIATYFITGLILIVGSFIIAWYVSQFSSDYDYTDPDMTFLERIVTSPDPQRGDFSALNGGKWQALCLIGWQGDLAKAMADAKLAPVSTQAILTKHGARVGEAEASEFMLIYTNTSGEAKALTHPHGFAFVREGQAACTTAAQPVLQLPVANPF